MAASGRGKLLVRGSINIDGKGANQAVSAAKAGADVDFAGSIGEDGTWLRQTLENYGVGVSLLHTDAQLSTGRAIIQLSTSTADNSIVLNKGANFSLAAPPLSPPQLSEYTHLLLQNEISLDETKRVLRDAHAAGLTTLLNPSPMLTREELAAFEWDQLDWLVINEGEGEDLLLALADGAEAGKGDAKALLGALRATVLRGLTGIIMTRGAEGVVASLRAGEVVEVGPGKVVGEVKDTTGAGDCFTGFFATLLSTLPRDEALSPATLSSVLSIACQAAAMCVEKHGAMESVPTLKDVKERMGVQWGNGRPWQSLLA
ncbi:hypothetical protein Rhopal_007530-T1 [Rhodotorula paludigena]|uniref:Carbohydrate kinase PfkB domain-containing protein n=1 Tax=Rhodotorula paludigena TaxID=86838 RepID=A0AAV5GWV6_9BASI|nr:hypothetical protein Rhopal_007530-T1 [Rhodotorula paludigena]